MSSGELLKAFHNAVPGIGLIKIFKPIIEAETIYYPVQIDSLPTIFRKRVQGWYPAKHAAFINEELRVFIETQIKSLDSSN